MTRRSKIIATIGPASDEPDVLRRMVDAGMDVARLGLAHGTAEEHLATLERIRAASAEAGRPVGVLADLPGPKIRSGEFPDAGVDLVAGATALLCSGERPCDASRIDVDYPGLLEDVEVGDQVVIGDGAVVLLVDEVRKDGLVAIVVHGGRVRGRPGVHLPAEKLRLSTPTDEDLALLDVLVPANVDVIAVSFVREAGDVIKVRDAIGSGGPKVMAKIETPAAIDHLDEIVQVSDAVMVARGDLAIECALEEVPHLQKRIVRTCVSWGRPVVTATQMLESLVTAPTPTRAEVSDVANAVFDGTDALMLSGETAIGHDPVGAVRLMARIATRAERDADYLQWGGRVGRRQGDATLPEDLDVTAAMTHAAWRAASEASATAILCCTRSGHTVRAMARFRPHATLIGLTPDERTMRQLTLTWGAIPLLLPQYETIDEMVDNAIETARRAGHVAKGDVVAVLAGAPSVPRPVADVLRLVRVE